MKTPNEKNPFLARAIQAHRVYESRHRRKRLELDGASKVEEHGDGQFYVVLRAGGNVIGVYLIIEDGAVRRMSRYPASIR